MIPIKDGFLYKKTERCDSISLISCRRVTGSGLCKCLIRFQLQAAFSLIAESGGNIVAA
jgi:hypothetical protein